MKSENHFELFKKFDFDVLWSKDQVVLYMRILQLKYYPFKLKQKLEVNKYRDKTGIISQSTSAAYNFRGGTGKC